MKGIFLRGGLTFGKVFHKGNICFGPALINSVMLESKYAKYPCVAVDKSIVEKILSDMKSDLEDDYVPGYKMPHKLKNLHKSFFSIIYQEQIIATGPMTSNRFLCLIGLLQDLFKAVQIFQEYDQQF